MARTTTKGSKPLKREDESPPVYTASSGGFRGRAPKPVDESPKLPVTDASRPTHDFRLMAHPERWDVVVVDGKAQILPVLIEVRGRPGLDGVVRANDVETRIASFRRKGFIELRDGPVDAFGETVESYRQEFDLANGDKLFTTAWRRPRLMGAGVRWDHDLEGEVAYRQRVKDEVFGGQVPRDALVQLRTDIESIYETSLDGRESVKQALKVKVDALRSAV